LNNKQDTFLPDSPNDHGPKFILFCSNIPEEKQTNCNTEERYLELENILNSMLDPVHITNRDFEVEFTNRACSEIFGFHTPGIKCYRYFHNLESPCKWCRHEEVMMGKSYHTENFFTKTKTYFDANHSPLTKANGEIAKLVILRDVTERKNTEESLRESEARFQTLFNTMAEGVAVHEIITDEKGTASDYIIVEANHAFEVLTGITIKDAVGKKASELYGAGKPPYFGIYIKVVETGQPHDFVAYFEPFKKYFRISVFSPGGKRFATVFDDITESRKNEEEREKLYHELKDALAKVKVLSGMLPICASCKKIRDDKGYWSQVETYLSKHTDTVFSHSICPECVIKLYPNLLK
jgi:PAS domain S-box-containing protein